MAASPRELESALQTLVETFYKYAGKDLMGRQRRAIGRNNFRKLLSCELHHMLTVSGELSGAGGAQWDLEGGFVHQVRALVGLP